MSSEVINSEMMSITTNSDFSEISRNQLAFEDNENLNKDKSFVHQILDFQISKAFQLFISVFLFLLLTCVIVAVISFNKTDQIGQYRSKKHVTLARSIVISSDKKIWIFDVDKKNCILLKTTKNDIISLDTYLEETIFWNEINTSVIASLWNTHPNVVFTKKLKAQAIAVDYVTNKLYSIDKASGSLYVMDVRQKNFGLIYSDLEEPHDLVLDPAEGLMFVVQFYKSIIRANMDGTMLKTIIEGNKISAITIDRKATRIYWANDQTSIESSNYDGSNRQVVTSIPMNVVSLSVFENQLFWTRSTGWSNVCPCTNVLWTCTLYRRSCNNISSHRLPFDSPRIVKSSFDQQRHLVKNPCAKDNGGCHQLCLMTSKGSHDCACNIGWTLKSDGKSCEPVSQLLLFPQGEFVRARIIGSRTNESFTSAIVPTRFHTQKMNRKTSVHFDYDMTNGEFYFSDDSSVNRLNLIRDDEQSQLLGIPENFALKDVLYDWTKDSLVYVKQSQEPSNNHTLNVFSLKPGSSSGSSHRIILSSKFKKESHVDCPHDLVIHPSHEYIFFAEYNGVNDNLRRVSSSGKGLILWKPFYSNAQLNFLAMDLERSRLYWSLSANAALVKSQNLEGTEEENVSVPGVVGLLNAGVKDGLMYVCNFTEIWSVRRDNGAEPRRLVKAKFQRNDRGGIVYEHVHGLRVYSLAARDRTD